MKKKQKKYVINQYLEIGGRLQMNFSNFRLDFRLKYWFVCEVTFQVRVGVLPPISRYREAIPS